jgi:hypothetical protein
MRRTVSQVMVNIDRHELVLTQYSINRLICRKEVNLDRKLKISINKSLRGIRDIEKKIEH